MIFRRSILGSVIRAGNLAGACRTNELGSGLQLHRLPRMSESVYAFAGPMKKFRTDTPLASSVLVNLHLMRTSKNVSLPYTLCFRSYRQSVEQAGADTQKTNRSIDYAQGLLQENGVPSLHLPRSIDYAQGLLRENGRSIIYPPKMEGNADIVHIKLMRNNAFVTLTDSKGNKKLGTSAGKLSGKGGKLTRYSAEAAAEDIGQKVRQMKTNSVVVKVNGSTFFRKKKQAILSFKDGYSHSREESNPIVYIEDTTRKPHNGCRLKKKRRI